MKSHIIALFAIASLAIVFASCNKEEDTLAKVNVVTANGTPVPGAEVRLYGKGTIDTSQVGNIRIDRTQFTNANGLAEFDFSDLYQPGQSGFAILDVEITKEFPDSTVFRAFIMQIIEEKTNEKTFRLE